VLGVVLAQELDGLVAAALLFQATQSEQVSAPVVAQAVVIMVGQAAVEALDLDPVMEDTIKFCFLLN